MSHLSLISDSSLLSDSFVLGSSGAIIIYFASAINIISYAPPEMSGVISAWTQVVAQVGGTITLAVQSAFEGQLLFNWMNSAGRTFWFIFAWTAALGLQYIVFYRNIGTPVEEHEKYKRAISQETREDTPAPSSEV